VIVEVEFFDGSHGCYNVTDTDDAWRLVRELGKWGELVSAWRDDEPWFGLCTDVREGVA
jgi:hypothetical protein